LIRSLLRFAFPLLQLILWLFVRPFPFLLMLNLAANCVVCVVFYLLVLDSFFSELVFDSVLESDSNLCGFVDVAC
jgi:hypothetical protein